MLIQISWGLCFLPNNNFSFADSIDLLNKFAENVCVCVVLCIAYVCTRAGLRASAFTLSLCFFQKTHYFLRFPLKDLRILSPHTKKRFLIPSCSGEVALLSTLSLSSQFSCQTFSMFLRPGDPSVESSSFDKGREVSQRDSCQSSHVMVQPFLQSFPLPLQTSLCD